MRAARFNWSGSFELKEASGDCDPSFLWFHEVFSQVFYFTVQNIHKSSVVLLFFIKTIFWKNTFNSVGGVLYLFQKLSMTRSFRICRSFSVTLNTFVGGYGGLKAESCGSKSHYRPIWQFLTNSLTHSDILIGKTSLFGTKYGFFSKKELIFSKKFSIFRCEKIQRYFWRLPKLFGFFV